MNKYASPSLLSSARDICDLMHLSFWITPKPSPDIPSGDGHAVIVVPGVFCNDFLTAPVRKYLRALRYDARGWDGGINFGPTRQAMRRLEDLLFAANDRTGRRVSLIGKSLGGMMIRELAKKHPERVRRLILVCAPIRHPIGNRIAPFFYIGKSFFDPSIPAAHEELSRPAPVPTTTLYTKKDGMLAWQCCLEEPGPLAENVELPGAYHTTAAMHPTALRVMAERLALPDRG